MTKANLYPPLRNSRLDDRPEQPTNLHPKKVGPGTAYQPTHTSAGANDSSSETTAPAPSCCCNVLVAYEPYSQGPDHDPAEWFRRCPIHERDDKRFWLFIDTLEDFDDATRSARLTPQGQAFRRELLAIKNSVNPQHGGKP